ncbi:E3 ubiquitin-protein ligase-like protein, partial [Eschrichtius robustus]|nr:E3 ubiquitin-protein ligase-like protein [Eschrichtius robustus]
MRILPVTQEACRAGAPSDGNKTVAAADGTSSPRTVHRRPIRILLRLVSFHAAEDGGSERRSPCSSHTSGKRCLKQYVELLIKEGLETAISCPDAACPKQGHLQENEIECMVAAEIMQRYKKLQFEREVLLDPCRTWCPASTCQAVCQLQEMGLQTPQLVQCKACDTEFCSACKASWHPGQGCPETMPITFLPGETSSAFPLEEDDVPIKRCPKCKVYIERDEGCAQMMCKNCKHAFCWYCLESLDTAAFAVASPDRERKLWTLFLFL